MQRDWWFKTADGTLGQIVALRGDDTAEVALEGRSDHTVTLPLAELRRAADPSRKLPPIEGLPAERPRCAYCNRPLRPMTTSTSNPAVWAGQHFNPMVPRVLHRVFFAWNAYAGLFCRHKCATSFAAAAHKAGYRVKRA